MLKMLKKKLLNRVDRKITNFITANVDIMPIRMTKAIAYYYPDARVRKLYLKKINVYMGEGTYSNLGLLTDATEEAPVYIGDNVSIAPNVCFITVSSPNNGKRLKEIYEIKTRLEKKGSIIIADEVWIGAGVTILPGVRIGEGSVIGAGAVVIEDVESYSVYAGVPAKKIRSLQRI